MQEPKEYVISAFALVSEGDAWMGPQDTVLDGLLLAQTAFSELFLMSLRKQENRRL